MSFKALQQRTEQWISKHEEGYWDPMAQIVCLTEEVGELAKEVNHRFGPKRKKSTEEHGDLALEIADCVVILCCLANSLQIDLDDAWQQTWDKFETRDKDRFPKRLSK